MLPMHLEATVKPDVPKLKPTVYIAAAPELAAERRRLVQSRASHALPRRHRVAAGPALATLCCRPGPPPFD